MVLGAFFLYSFLEPRWLQTKAITFTDADIPPDFDGARLVFVTDIHHGPYLSLRRVRALVARINGLRPDLILLGGDYIHRSAAYITPCFAELRDLQAPLGVFGVLGNHDHWAGADAVRTAMVAAGIKPLDNAALWLQRGEAKVKLGGVGDFLEDRQEIGPTIGDVHREDFVILLTHNPDYCAGLATDRVDLVLCGHTHGGQVTFFGLWAPLVPSRYGQRYRTGIKMVGDATTLIVANGVGTITPPVRFWARPQIVVVELRRPAPSPPSSPSPT